MTVIIVDLTGRNVGSAYKIVGNTYAWNVWNADGNRCRQGRAPTQEIAATALFHGAAEIGINGVIQVLSRE